MNNLIYWIWLSQACTPDSATFPRLLDSFDSAEAIWSASDREIRSAVGTSASDCNRLINKDLSKAQEIYDFCTSKGVGILTYADEEFPESLRLIPTPPVLLYYRGKLPNFNTGFRCAIVGTRRLSDYGRTNAFKLGYDMGCAGATVVSGMAIGIDGVALAGAIASGSTTIAVIGSGIDVCYPIEHKRLAREIVKNGCVLTEYAPGTKPDRYNFPRRNRIISGLSAVTVVIEGKEDSGAMITARHAKNQDRPVYAFPGNVGSPNSQLSNLLIKNGANLCTGADDIVRDFEKEYIGILNPFKLEERIGVNMNDVLKSLEVCAVSPSDDIFKPSRRKANATAPDNSASNDVSLDVSKTKVEKVEVLPTFDPKCLKIYKKIPTGVEYPIESLTDEENDLRSVMKLLLKLEMGKFIVMLPGERVKRNLK